MAELTRYLNPATGDNTTGDGLTPETAWKDLEVLRIVAAWGGLTGSDTLILNCADGDITPDDSNPNQILLRCGLRFIPETEGGVTCKGIPSGGDLFSSNISSLAGATIELAGVVWDCEGSNNLFQCLSTPSSTWTIDITNAVVINIQEGFIKYASGSFSDVIGDSPSFTSLSTATDFRSVIGGATTSTTMRGSIDITNPVFNGSVVDTGSGFGIIHLNATSGQSQTFNVDSPVFNLTVTNDSATNQFFGVYANDFSSMKCNDPIITMGTASSDLRHVGVNLDATNNTADVSVLNPIINFTHPQMDSTSRGPINVQIGDINLTTGNSIKSGIIGGGDSNLSASLIDGAGATSGTGIMVYGVEADNFGDLKAVGGHIHTTQFAIHFHSCRNIYSASMLMNDISDVGQYTRLTGCTNCFHANHTFVSSVNREAGFMNAQSLDSSAGAGLTGPTRDSYFYNNNCLILDGSDYTSGSHFICRQGDGGDDTQLEADKSVAGFIGNNFYQADYVGAGGTLPFDFDAYGTLNNTFADWKANYPYSGTLTSSTFVGDETNLDPKVVNIINEDYRLLADSPIGNTGINWMPPGNVIDFDGRPFARQSTSVGYVQSQHPEHAPFLVSNL